MGHTQEHVQLAQLVCNKHINFWPIVFTLCIYGVTASMMHATSPPAAAQPQCHTSA